MKNMCQKCLQTFNAEISAWNFYSQRVWGLQLRVISSIHWERERISFCTAISIWNRLEITLEKRKLLFSLSNSASWFGSQLVHRLDRSGLNIGTIYPHISTFGIVKLAALLKNWRRANVILCHKLISLKHIWEESCLFLVQISIGMWRKLMAPGNILPF